MPGVRVNVPGTPTPPCGAPSGGYPAEVTCGALAMKMVKLACGLTQPLGEWLLTSTVNILTTVAVANDSVKLPPATANNVGQSVYVFNTTATSAQVYGSGTDTINGVATGTGVAVAGNKTGLFVVQAAGKWVGVLALA